MRGNVMKYTYNQALRQFCLQCKTKKSNCKKEDCKRYAAFKECMWKAKAFDKLMSEYVEIREGGRLGLKPGAWLRKDQSGFVSEIADFIASERSETSE